MLPHHELLAKVQATVAASPSLQKQLAASQSTEQAAQLLSQALGSAVTAKDLQNLSETAKPDMTDEQLEAVAGGDRGGAIFISIITAGAFCALASIVYASKDHGAGECSDAFK